MQHESVIQAEAFSNTYNEGILSLGEMFGDLWKRGVLTAANLVVCNGAIECLVSVYGVCVKKRHCLPLEQLSPEDKAGLWQMAITHGAGLTKDQKVAYCKAIWTLGNILNK